MGSDCMDLQFSLIKMPFASHHLKFESSIFMQSVAQSNEGNVVIIASGGIIIIGIM